MGGRFLGTHWKLGSLLLFRTKSKELLNELEEKLFEISEMSSCLECTFKAFVWNSKKFFL